LGNQTQCGDHDIAIEAVKMIRNNFPAATFKKNDDPKNLLHTISEVYNASFKTAS
jgi:hypothetical protein